MAKIAGNSVSNRITGTSSADTILGMAGNDTLNAGGGNDLVYGGLGNDSIIGGYGNDTLRGESGHDTFLEEKLNGSDYIDGGSGTDTVTYIDSYSGYAVSLDVSSSTLFVTRGGSVDSLISIEKIYGSNSAHDSITAPTDADGFTVNLASGAISGINSTLSQVYRFEDVIGTAAADKFIGGAGANNLLGGSGNDTLDGGVGNDNLMGGQGDDTYIVDAMGDLLTEAVGDGTDTVLAGVSYTLADNFETLILTGTGHLSATGNTANNQITGNAGNNTLDGAGGADTMAGGSGNDLYRVNHVGDVVTESAGQGTDTVEASIDYTLDDEVENLTLTGSATYGVGNTLGNYMIGNTTGSGLYGGDGNDTLQSLGGFDLMYGQLGDDLILGSELDDNWIEGGEGNDTILGGDGYEAELVGGTGDDRIETGSDDTFWLEGNEGNDTIIGGSGDQWYINGGLGNDSIDGGDGDEYYAFDADFGTDTLADSSGFDILDFYLAGNITINLVSGVATNGADLLTFTGVQFEEVWGSTDNNLIYGNSLANTFYGDEGNDTLSASGGNDSLAGGDGNDTYTQFTGTFDATIYDSTGTDVLDLSGYDLADVLTWATVDSADGDTNIEHLLLTFSGGNSITIVDYFDNTALSGFASGQGDGLIETIIFDDDSNVDFTQVRLLTNPNVPTTGDDWISGNTANNTIDALTGNDTIYGLAGSDSLYGGDGNDIIYGGSGFDQIFGNDGDDVLVSDSSTDWFFGGSGNDTYNGFSSSFGADRIDDSLGNDILDLSSFNLSDVSSWQARSYDGDYFVETLLVTLNNGSSLRIENYFDNTSVHHNDAAPGLGYIETISFSDDSLVDFTQVSSLAISAVFAVGDSTDNYLSGSMLDDTIYGFAGNDTIVGVDGLDCLFGGNGNDLILGGESNGDELSGDSGNDTIQGGNGNDDYNINIISFGSDLISDTGGGDFINLLLDGYYNHQIENVVSWNALDSGIDGLLDQLLIDFGNGNTLTIQNYFDNSSTTVSASGQGAGLIEMIRFSNYVAEFDDVTNILNGGTISGNPLPSGLYFEDNWGNIIDADANNLFVCRVTSNLTVNLTVSSGNEITDGTNTIDWNDNRDEFLGGSGNDLIFASSENCYMEGSAGNDTIYGNSYDVFEGRQGNDSLIGGVDDDEYGFGWYWDEDWGADTIQDNGGVDLISVSSNFGCYITVNLNSGAGHEVSDGISTINWSGDVIENIEVSSYGPCSIIGNASDNWIDSDSDNDTISGGAGNDTILSEWGNDILDGGQGDDSLHGSAGNDTYHNFLAGFGVDTILDTSGNDILDLDNYNLADALTWGIVNTDNLLITFAGGNSITIDDYFDNTGTAQGTGYIETISFADDALVDFAQVQTLIT